MAPQPDVPALLPQHRPASGFAGAMLVRCERAGWLRRTPFAAELAAGGFVVGREAE